MSGDNREQVSAYMATMPSRQPFLQPVLDSLKHQVDHLYVYCNYPPDTDVPYILHQDWITVQGSGDSGDLGCTGRFYFSEKQKEGYVFLVDDDIVYTRDYVSEMISGIERFGRKAVLSCHGGILPNRVSDFTSQRQLYDFEETIPTDRVVNIVGLGVSAFHSTTLNVSVADFPSINRDDLWFAVKCQKERIPLIVMGRKIKLCSGLYDNYSLWKTERRDKAFSLKQTQIAQTVAWKVTLPAIQPGVSILISTSDNDLEKFRRTLRSITALSLQVPVELVVSAPFASQPTNHVLEEDLYSIRRSMAVKWIQIDSGRGMGACLRAGLNECKFDLVSVVQVGASLTPYCISRQQRYILNNPQCCLVECAPDGHAVRESEQDDASVYIIQRHVLQVIEAFPGSGKGWDECAAVLIKRLIENQLSVVTNRFAAEEFPGGRNSKTAEDTYSVFAPFSRDRPTQFVRT